MDIYAIGLALFACYCLELVPALINIFTLIRGRWSKDE